VRERERDRERKNIYIQTGS